MKKSRTMLPPPGAPDVKIPPHEVAREHRDTVRPPKH